MGTWNNIAVGFDIAEETINFGTRAVALCEGGIYESTTLATIQSDGKADVSAVPSCHGLCSQNSVAVTCDKTLIFFDIGFTAVQFTIHFDSPIECIEISKNGAFIFCGLKNYAFICLHIASNGKVVFSKKLLENEHSSIEHMFSSLISRCTDEYLDIYAVLNNGMIVRAFCEDIININEAVKDEKNDVSEKCPVEFSTVKAPIPYCNRVIASQLYTYEDEVIVFAVSNDLSIWGLNGEILEKIQEGNQYHIKKLFCFPSSHVLICLCDDGFLLIICLHTLQVIKKWDDIKIKDLILLENSEYKPVTEILVVTDSEEPELCLVELPALEVKLRLKVSKHSYLVNKQSTTEDILYIEALGEELIDTIHVKVIAESNPELRLDRLLQRCKFIEAEKFARNLSLSLEDVYKAKVKWLMEKLQLINKMPDSLTKYFEELTTLLEKIQDVEFVGECCLKVIAPDLKMTQHLFKYAAKRLRQCTEKTPTVIKLMDEVTKSNVTLGTYIQVNEDSNSPENWLIFFTSNPIVICKNHLLRGEIQKAVIVCRRHEERIRHDLPRGVAIELLEKIPSSVPVDSVLPWLRAYIPVLLQAHAELLPTLISWIIERTKSLELEKKSVWPENGLTFVEEVLEILKELPNKDLCLELPLPLDNNNGYSCSPITSLLTFARHIHQLTVLKNEYSISVDFEEYLNRTNEKNDHQGFLSLILDNVSESKIPSLISGFLKNYCAENLLDKDEVLSSYVIRMIKLSSSWWDSESAWEGRAICFIGYIQSIQYKMEAIEETIANVTVPWSSDVTNLADSAMKVDHPLAEKIYHHLNSVPMKLTLRKYGLSNTPILTNDVRSLIVYVYKQNQDNMIEDAKQLVKSGKSSEELLPYILYLLHNIELGEIERGLEFVKSSLDEEKIVKVTQGAISNLMCFLQKRHIDFEDKAFDAIPTLYSTLMVLNPSIAASMEKDIHFLQSYRTLKVRYKVNISLSMLYKAEAKRKMFLRNHLSQLDAPDESNLTRFVEEACQIAFLFKLPRELALLELSYIYASRKNLSLSVFFARFMLDSENSFYESYSINILNLLTVLLEVVTNGMTVDEESWRTIHSLLRKIALFVTKANEVVKIGNLFSIIRLCSPVKQIVGSTIGKNYYADHNIEASLIYPPPTYCNILIHGTFDQTDKDNKDSKKLAVYKEIEKALQSMPHNVSSVHRLQTILWTLLPNEEKRFREIIKDKVFNVLGRVVYARNLDLELALALLKLVPLDSGMSWLNNYLSSRRDNSGNLKTAAAVALVGKHYIGLTPHWNNLSLQKTFAEYYLKFECFMRLQKFSIPPRLADAYCDTHEGKKNLLLKLMTFNGVDFNFLHDFCRDLNFSFQECLQLYLEHTLLTWKPQYEESINPKTGKSELLLLTKKEDLALKCSQIENLTTRKEDLVDYLKKIILPRVNFYYYEVFIVIIDTILELCPKHQEFFIQHQLLLSFLMSYRRISPVSSEETDNWFHYFPDQSGVPQISKYRLPFASLPSDPWKIIKPELSLKTYKLWLNAPMWLNVSLEKDVICSFTIMNLKGEVANTSEWNLHFQYKSLMADIAECISKMQNIETAVAASYCVVNYIMPPGADRVDAAQRCFLKAQEWVALEHTESAKIGLMKAEKKYLTVSTYHFLYKYQLARPEYLGLAHQPANLIAALYTDPSIVTRTTDLTSPQPDINRAVERIAALHDIKLVAVLKESLTEWLQPNNSLNSSFENVNVLPTSSTYSDNIIRACYVLNGFKDLAILETTIMNIAFSQDNCTMSAGVRLRALQCLRATKTNKELERLTLRDVSTIRDLMLSMEFVADLEKFALDYTILEFDSSYKEEIIETLLKRSCPGALVLSVKIAITYQVWIPSIWNSLLSFMTSLNMSKVLEYCLPQLGHMTNQVDESIFKAAWECLLFTSFSQVRNGKDAKKEIEKTFSLIEVCPIISSLDLQKIIHHYLELGYTELADLLSKFT